jgi:Zn finger protein HypA/HybF involved in hydrogenase expression
MYIRKEKIMESIFLSKGINYLKNVVSDSTSLTQVINHFSYSKSGAAFGLLKNILNKYQVDYSHFTKQNTKIYFNSNSKPIEYYLKSNFVVDRKYLKKRIINEKLLDYKCQICCLDPIWNEKTLSLHLDHINGQNDDNRLENLRFLCPNCHSQTETYSGKSRRNKCIDCFAKISSKSTRCPKCSTERNKSLQAEVFDINPDVLRKEVWELPMNQLSIKYGCSDKLIAKRCEKYNIEKPPRGYFLKK